MAESIEDIQRILWVARMGAVGDRWHLNERAVPRLKTLADETGEPRLNQVAERAAKAGEHFAAARDALRGAIHLAEACDSNRE